MATQVQNINKTSAGLCPHGLPPSACPICSKMGSGGGTRPGERAQRPGEMSYDECLRMGAIIRSRLLAQKEQRLQNQLEALRAFESAISKLKNNLQKFIERMSNNIITKPIAFVAKNFAMPFLKFIQNIPQIIQNISKFIQNLKIDIQDKLNAIFGEIKNFIQKKVSDIVSALKNKLKNLFKIFKKNNSDDEDTKIDDDKKIFNLKNILRKIIRKKKEKDDKHSKDQ